MFSAVVSLVFAVVCIITAASLMRRKRGPLIEVRSSRTVIIIGLVYGGIQSAYIGLVDLIKLLA